MMSTGSASPRRRRPQGGPPSSAKRSSPSSRTSALTYISAAAVVLTSAYFLQRYLRLPSLRLTSRVPSELPAQAQIISPRSFAVLNQVFPAQQSNGSTLFFPPGTDEESLKARPFHIYDDEFYSIIGSNPSLTIIADSGTDPLFHEANIWYPPTDEMFFVQNSGAKAAGTGMAKSAVILKIKLAEAAAALRTGKVDASGLVTVTTVDSSPQVMNPNGGTNYKGQLLMVGEGQGDRVASALYLMNPLPPYNTTQLVNNYFGRQFNSLNDVAINPRNKEVYFTDVTYGFLQDFRPSPGLPNQVYRFDAVTGMVSIVADGFDKPNGLTFSPDGSYAYVTDTGRSEGFRGKIDINPATIYRFTVHKDGTWDNRKTFAYVTPGSPDGIHCDTKGNVYAGCGDGVQVFNPSGKLIGKIYLGEVNANFQFAGKGRIVMCAETRLRYAELAAEGAPITDYDYAKVE